MAHTLYTDQLLDKSIEQARLVGKQMAEIKMLRDLCEWMYPWLSEHTPTTTRIKVDAWMQALDFDMAWEDVE